MPRLNPKSSAPSESSTHPDCGDGFTADCAHIVIEFGRETNEEWKCQQISPGAH